MWYSNRRVSVTSPWRGRLSGFSTQAECPVFNIKPTHVLCTIHIHQQSLDADTSKSSQYHTRPLCFTMHINQQPWMPTFSRILTSRRDHSCPRFSAFRPGPPAKTCRVPRSPFPAICERLLSLCKDLAWLASILLQLISRVVFLAGTSTAGLTLLVNLTVARCEIIAAHTGYIRIYSTLAKQVPSPQNAATTKHDETVCSF